MKVWQKIESRGPVKQNDVDFDDGVLCVCVCVGGGGGGGQLERQEIYENFRLLSHPGLDQGLTRSI